jgi:DNA segregation ATPase FtsK/SpoIIIE-like protein
VVDETQRLRVMPVFFDEFGLLSDDRAIAHNVKALSRGGRKFGIYLIAGSQTWYSDEIASSLKANLSTSIQFYAKTKSQSRVLLGESAAYEIIRPGQAFCRLPGQAGLIEIQAPDATNVIDEILEKFGRV